MGSLSLLGIVAIATAICLTSGPIFAKKCGNKATTAYRKVGLDTTNNYRGKHKDTPPLALDDGLNKAAQDCAQMLADTGKWGHLCGAKEAGHGENLATGSGNANDPPEKLIKQAVDMWYAEIANYSYSSPDEPKGTVGHFTQLVWKNSQKLGLGLATKGNRWVIAGRYTPPGNYRGQNGKNVMPLK